jgi:hypothetical protein
MDEAKILVDDRLAAPNLTAHFSSRTLAVKKDLPSEGRTRCAMSATDRTVQVTLTLPEEVYTRVAEAAAREERQLVELLATLVAEGLDAHATSRETLERVSIQYRARLATENRLNQSPEEILQELGDLREQVAGELYP